MTSALTTVYQRSERMVARRIVDEFVLVPIVSRGADVDAIFSLNKLGAFIWERIDGVKSGAEVVDAILETFDVAREAAVADYERFVAQLVSIKAVEPVDGAAERELPLTGAAARRRK
jgi:hypothetical protein